MVNSPEFFMQFALDKAWAYQGLTFPNPPVGAVITDNQDRLLSYGVHKEAGSPHAEVNAIKQAYLNITKDKEILKFEDASKIHEYLHLNHNGIFEDKNIYVTLEPCNHFGKTPPCSHLIKELGFKKIYIGTLDSNLEASGGKDFLQNAGFSVDVGLLEDKCKDLLEPFTIWQQNNPFIFFKLAMSNNGVIDGGVITCKSSRELVHRLRDKNDLLVIGGSTVRKDRPTLDARLCGGKAPDVLIYSKSTDFDRDIPLFKIPNRKVFIDNNFKKLEEYRFVMIEGGEGMLKAVSSFVDHYLIFRSASFKTGYSPKINISLKEINSSKIGEDRLFWFKKLDG